MPTILLAHANAEEAEPIAKALKASGWTVQRRGDAASALALVKTGSVGAALVSDPLLDGSGLTLAERLVGDHQGLPVVVLAKPGANVDAHKAGPRAARAYLDRTLDPKQIAAELQRAVRTLPGTARPPSSAMVAQQAVMAALRELDTMRPASDARPPTPPEIVKVHRPEAPRAELEQAQRKIRELEQAKLQLEKAAQKREAEHALAVSSRDEMLRHLELALEALTQDLTHAATGLAEQQDRAGMSETRLHEMQSECARLQQQLAASASQGHELRKELGELKALLLASELDTHAAQEALQRAMEEAHAGHRRAMEAEAQRSDLIRALNAHKGDSATRGSEVERLKAELDASRREAAAEHKHNEDEVARLKKKLQAAERALEEAALHRDGGSRAAR